MIDIILSSTDTLRLNSKTFFFLIKLFLPIHWLSIGQTFEIIKEWRRSENISLSQAFNPAGLYRQGLSSTNLSCNFQWKQERSVTIRIYYFIRGLIVQYGIITLPILFIIIIYIRNFHSILFRILYFDNRNKNPSLFLISNISRVL